MSAEGHIVKVEGREIAVSNVDKVLYPAVGLKKRQVIDYYIRIADYLLPHLKDRPVTLKRFPDGVGGKFFYEKDAPSSTPDWVQRFSVPRRGRGGDVYYILINDLPTLVWVANLASLELHSFLHRVPRIDSPTEIVFDLDPGPGADILTCARVAFLLREVLGTLQLKAFAKVSGSKGLQVYVPLNTTVKYETSGPFAKTLAQIMQQRHPELIVSKMSKELRAGRVFIDWSQNSDFKTTIAVYSLRANAERPYVSLPVAWEELQRSLDKEDAASLHFEPEATLRRVAERGDLFAAVETLKQRLPSDIGQPARKQTKSHTRQRAGRK